MYSVVRYDALTEQHYVTIPDSIIQLLGLAIGDTLEWHVENDKVYIKKQ